MSGPAPSRFEPRMARRRVAGWLFRAACLAATLLGLVILVVLVGAVVSSAAKLPGGISGVVGLTNRFSSAQAGKSGFLAGIVGSIWLLLLVALMAIPVGVGAAVYLEEFARPGRVRDLIGLNLANLAGVPSIVYGILGLAAFVRVFGHKQWGVGETLWAGGMTLSLLVLPVVVIASREALRTVPPSLRQAALALGATRWQMVRDHVLPSAVPGILTGTILALSRAIGETAPLLLVGAAGSIRFLPSGPSSRYTALPVEIYSAARTRARISGWWRPGAS